jgi:hypothetical protein
VGVDFDKSHMLKSGLLQTKGLASASGTQL